MIALCGGGTGGHIYPAIALAQELGGENCFFITSQDRVDSEIVRRYGFQTVPIAFNKKRKMWGLFAAIRQANSVLKTRQPRAVIATGGYFTLPVIIAAEWQKIPIFILEQNILPGRVNRLAARFARVIYTAFTESSRFLPKKVQVKPLGNPVRSTYVSEPPAADWRPIVESNRPMMLVIGGSQGAAALNRYIIERKSEFLASDWNVVHLMGQGGYHKEFGDTPFSLVSDESGTPRVAHLPYFEGMDLLYRHAKVAIARAGATTLAELRHFQLPAVLVPFPFAKDDHQRINAEVAEAQGGATVISEADLLKLPVPGLIARIHGISPIEFPENTEGVAKQIVADIRKEIRPVI